MAGIVWAFSIYSMAVEMARNTHKQHKEKNATKLEEFG